MMDIKDFSDLKEVLERLDDNFFWKPLEPEECNRVTSFIDKIEESKTWVNRNQEKGALLEDFVVFLFKRFQGASVKKNLRVADNETDVEVALSDVGINEFMKMYMFPKVICECKNKARSSVDVGMVAKLAELLPVRESKTGIFFSINGIGGSGWRFGEGKRKKIFNKHRVPILSFRIEELRMLIEGKNLLTMIREKINKLIDEVDDESPDIPDTGHVEYAKRMKNIILHLKQCSLVNHEEAELILNRIHDRYGNVDLD
ncbi:hypothetical protein [Paenibacillus kobensis]|uniref:hypothetical protein n=1 Tax=Paenibacillus kobensis TaxID=59841 RepID=UPI000FD73DA2|nr:hypothetical protein [Paenibacillus kobensis]